MIRRASSVVAVLAASAALVSTAAATPPPQLSTYGRQLWNFEALLHDQYGRQPACARARASALNWTTASCRLPAADGGVPYQDVFADAHGSAFHLIPRTAPIVKREVMTNVAPIEIASRAIACDRSATRLFVEFHTGLWGCS